MKWASNNRNLTFAMAVVILAALLLSWRVSFWQRQVRLNHALIRAVNKDDTLTAERLLDEGADPNTRDGYRSPAAWPVRVWDQWHHRQPPPAILGNPVLLTATENGNVSIVKDLVAHEADVNPFGNESQDPEDGQAPLCAFEDFDNPAIATADLQCLIAAGANVNAHGLGGDTPLMEAGVDLKSVQTLIRAGASVNGRDDLNETPIILLVAYQEPSDGEEGETIAVFRELLAAGADINARDDAGYTALMDASYGGLTRVVKFLLAQGARTDFRGTNNGEDALELAKDAGNKAMVALLVQAERKQSTHAGTFSKGAGKREK